MTNPHRSKIAHRIVFSELAQYAKGALVGIDGSEAYHAATVKRIRVGDVVGVFDGRGTEADGVVEAITGHKTKPIVEIRLDGIQTVPKAERVVEIWTALPKGDRLEAMVDQLSQLGVARWRAVECDRSERKWASVKCDKLVRTTHESAKQCGRAWFLEIGEPISFAEAIAQPGVVVADGSGAGITSDTHTSTSVVLLIGPEGGWSDDERQMMAEASVPMVRFGVHVLRLETAACAAAALMNRV